MLEHSNARLSVSEANAYGEALIEGVAQAKEYADKLVLRMTYVLNNGGCCGTGV